MSKRKVSSRRGRKRAARGLAFCFIATVALTGAYTWTNYKNNTVEELEIAEAEIVEEEIETEEASGVAEKEEAVEEFSDPADLQEKEEEILETVNEVAEVNFSETDLLLWPVDGNVKMSYSMDKTVYFETLDQYKYNPALIISATENDEVIAAAVGIVSSIEVLPETGTTVTLDMGNGYECVYGQLKQVQVNTGDYVAAGQIIGYLSEPTKYYSLEGCNLYFEMRKDGEAVNPVDYVSGEE